MAVLARGRDEYRHFQLFPGPPALSFDEAIAAQQASAGRFLAGIRKTRGHYAAEAGGG